MQHPRAEETRPGCDKISKYLEKNFQVLGKIFLSTWKFHNIRVLLKCDTDVGVAGAKWRVYGGLISLSLSHYDKTALVGHDDFLPLWI